MNGRYYAYNREQFDRGEVVKPFKLKNWWIYTAKPYLRKLFKINQ